MTFIEQVRQKRQKLADVLYDDDYSGIPSIVTSLVRHPGGQSWMVIMGADLAVQMSKILAIQLITTVATSGVQLVYLRAIPWLVALGRG